MKILHTSDWHLGKRLETISRLPEQIEAMDEICQIAKDNNVDAVLIAGDLFDAFQPPKEAEELFYKTLKRLSDDGKRAVIAIAGNHDSPKTIAVSDPLARECGIILIGDPNVKVGCGKIGQGIEILKADDGFFELKLPFADAPLRVIHTAFANEFRLKKFLGTKDPEEELRKALHERWAETAKAYCDNKGVNILVSHLLFMKKGGIAPEEPDDEKPILYAGGTERIYDEDLPDNIQYAALGHLHRCQIICDDKYPACYSGTPIAYSMSEAGQSKFVVIVDASPGEQAKLDNVLLSKGKKLCKIAFDSVDDAVLWLGKNQDALVELTIRTDTYLTADEAKRLHDAHKGIVEIIPKLKADCRDDLVDVKNIDLNKPIKELFSDYFRFRNNGQEPNAEILELFDEIVGRGGAQ